MIKQSLRFLPINQIFLCFFPCFISNQSLSTDTTFCFITSIMYKYGITSNKVGVEISDLEVINSYSTFKDLVLDPFDNNVLSVQGNKHVTGAELTSCGPILYGRIEGVLVCANDFLSVYINVYKLACFIVLHRDNKVLSRGRNNNLCTGTDYHIHRGQNIHQRSTA